MESKSGLPSSLFKYYSLSSNSLKVLINQEIWLSSRSLLNDPLDCNIELSTEISDNDFDKWCEELRSLKISSGVEDLGLANGKEETLENIRKLYELFRTQTGLFCLTEDPINPLMWAHYADGYSGFCIEFELDYDELKANGSFVGKVDYKNHPRLSHWEFFLQHCREDREGRVRLVGDLLSYKAEDWSYEKEWRAFGHLGDGKAGELVAIPGRINSIIFGMRMRVEDRRAIARCLGSDVRYCEVKRVPQSFDLKMHDVTILV